MVHSLAVATLLCLLSIVCYTQGHGRFGGKLSLGYLNRFNCHGIHQLKTDEHFSWKRKDLGFIYRVRCPGLYHVYQWLQIRPAVQKYSRDCKDLFGNGVKRSGVYLIYPKGSKGFKVYCDMTTDGGGWTVFQRRLDGSVDFYRNWNDYKNGFGHLNGEYWLGNEHLHELVAQGSYKLRVDLEDFSKQKRYAKYSTFYVAGSKDKYRLKVGGYTGNAGNSLNEHNGKMFSTKEADNDIYKGNCASRFKGGYWYGNCHSSNLNGLYLRGKTKQYATGVVWYHWHKYYYSLKATTMMVKRK